MPSSFEPETSYTKFGAYAVLNHGSDFSKAALSLARQGFGAQDDGISPTGETQVVAAPAYTDAGHAEFFERVVDHRLAFDHTARQWFEFDGHHWRKDTVKHVVERAV